MIEPSELSEFYAKVGEGIWHLQHVENALATCLALKLDLKEPGSVNREEAERHLAKHLRNTLGTSIRIAKEKSVLSQELMASLVEFKEERDWLVHRSMNNNGDDLYSPKLRSSLLARLERFSDQAAKLQALIAGEMQTHVLSKGVSMDRVLEIAAQEMARKERGNA